MWISSKTFFCGTCSREVDVSLRQIFHSKVNFNEKIQSILFTLVTLVVASREMARALHLEVQRTTQWISSLCPRKGNSEKITRFRFNMNNIGQWQQRSSLSKGLLIAWIYVILCPETTRRDSGVFCHSLPCWNSPLSPHTNHKKTWLELLTTNKSMKLKQENRCEKYSLSCQLMLCHSI